MCGIIGYIGNKNAVSIMLDGLKHLEYRGYDSAGIAFRPEGCNGIKCVKAVGRIKELERRIGKNKLSGTAGIAHTRWATHGHPTEANAHPHSDCAGRIWLVHNGIIENHAKLRKSLKKRGHVFLSETDTEVIAHLLEENYSGNLTDAVMKVLVFLKGTYGLVIMHADHPDMLIAAKMGSPLVVGIGKDECFIASDPSALLSRTKKVVYLNDQEVAQVSRNDLKIFNKNKGLVDRKVEELYWEYGQAQKGDFPDFMLKEIHEQPETIRDTIAGRLKKGVVKLGGLEDVGEELVRIKKIAIVGCGTARYAGLIGEYLFEEYAGIPTEVDYASEFKYRESELEKGSVVLAISQSGETADTKAAIEKAKKSKVLTLGIVNVAGSSIARETNAGIYTHSGPEIAVASTKTLTSQLSVLALMAVYLARVRKKGGRKTDRLAVELENIPTKIKEALAQSKNIKAIARKYSRFENFAFLGRKYNYPIACEGAIKLKEISYIHAEAFPSGEMKHGPIAMIDRDFPSIFIAPSDSVYDKNLSNMEEIKARSGRVIAIATKGNRKIASVADDVIYVPETIEALYPILTVIPLQLFAYYAAILRGNDVDKPRNLAKSVTVE